MRGGQTIAPAPQHAALLSDVEWALKRHVMSAARFGLEAIGDPNLVGDLHAGRMPRIDTVERILGYIDQLDLARVVARFGSVEEGIDRLVDVLIEAKDIRRWRWSGAVFCPAC